MYFAIILVLMLSSCSYVSVDSDLQYSINKYREVEWLILVQPFVSYYLGVLLSGCTERYASKFVSSVFFYLSLCAVNYILISSVMDLDIVSVYVVHCINILMFLLGLSFFIKLRSLKVTSPPQLDKLFLIAISGFAAIAVTSMYREGARVCDEYDRVLKRGELVEAYVNSMTAIRKTSRTYEEDYQVYAEALFREYNKNLQAGRYRTAISMLPFEPENDVTEISYLGLVSKLYQGHSFEGFVIDWPVPMAENKNTEKRVYADKCGNILYSQY